MEFGVTVVGGMGKVWIGERYVGLGARVESMVGLDHGADRCGAFVYLGSCCVIVICFFLGYGCDMR